MARVSYKKLWKLLIDRDMKKKDLREATHISSASMAKLGKKRERYNRRPCSNMCRIKLQIV